MQRKVTICLFLALLLVPLTAFGQVGFGSMKGHVLDKSGAAIVNAKITLKSDALMGDRTVTSGEKGDYRFINLPPGEYTLVVEKNDYKRFEQVGIMISSGFAAGVNVTLELGAFEEVLTITGDSPLIDVDSVEQKVNISGDLQRQLPTTVRGNYSEIMRLVPGTVLNDPNRPQYSYYAVKGASAYTENNWTIDGARINQWEFSYMSARINLDAVEDVDIGLSGGNAANNVGQGGTVNLTTKSGGNEFSGSASVRYQPTSWNDNNIEGGTPADTDFFEYGASLGGYIIKDRLWFFGTGRVTEINDGISRTPGFIEESTALYANFSTARIDKNMKDFFGKATFMASTEHLFTFTYQRDWGFETFAGGRYDPEAFIDEGTVGPMYNGTWNWYVNDDLNLYTQVSYMDKDRERSGRNPDKVNTDIFGEIALSSGLPSGRNYLLTRGNYASEFAVDESLFQITSTANYYVDDLYGTHELKVGTYIAPDNRNQFSFFTRTGIHEQQYVLSIPNDVNSDQILFYQRVYDREDRPDPEVKGRNYALFVNDTWKPTSRLSVEAGLRYDYISQSEELFDTNTDYISLHAFSPNIGINYAITEDRKNILRASYSLRQQNYAAYTLPVSDMGIQHGYRDFYDTDLNGDLDTILTVPEVFRDALPTSHFDDITLGRSHDFAIGYTRELPGNTTLSADYSYRQFRNMLTEYDTNHIIENNVWVGVKDPSRPFGDFDEIINNTWNWKEYQSIEVTLNRRMTDNLTILASLMYEIGFLKGDWAPFPEPFDDYNGDQYRYIQSGHFDSYSDEGGQWGGGDRGFTYRLNAAYRAPYDIGLSASIVGQGGPRSDVIYELLDWSDPAVGAHGPVSMFQDGYLVFNPLYTNVRLAGSDRKDGRWRSDTVTYVSVRAAKAFEIMQQRLEVSLDVFNLLNSATPIEHDARGENINSQYYGQNSTTNLQNARAAQLMVRYSF